jgi:hypothetical protein
MRRRYVMSVIAVGGAAAAYIRLARPRELRWGATDPESDRPLPGDGPHRQPRPHRHPGHHRAYLGRLVVPPETWRFSGGAGQTGLQRCERRHARQDVMVTEE